MKKTVKCGVVVLISIVLLVFGAIVTVFFSQWVEAFIHSEIVLRNGSQTYDWWKNPPVTPIMKIYVYNVTNADEFLNENGTKPILEELGPYVYREKWEKVNVEFNDNGTITFQQKKSFFFDPEMSNGSEDDAVVVPNIPMLSATSQSKHAARFLRLAMASIMDILKIKPFVEVTVEQLLWGYEDPLLKLAKDVVPKEQKLPYEEFGLLYGKNGTAKDIVTVWTGEKDITQYGLVNRFNGYSHMTHWKTEKCNRLNGSDGSIFPPSITENSTLYVYEKDMCRLLPLKFQKEVEHNDVKAFRFSPPTNVFADISRNPENDCFCPAGPPCAPNGLFNVSLCQYDSPILLSFPHFYLADPSLREAVEGMSPPDKEKHQLYLDIQPQMGTTMSAKARVQINLAVSQVVDIKQVASFPDIIFPILWFEDGIDTLPAEVTDLLFLATHAPPIAKAAISYGLFALGGVLLIISIGCIIRHSGRQETLHLENTSHYAVEKNGHTKDRSVANGHQHKLQLTQNAYPPTNGKKDTMETLNPAFVEAPESGVTS